MANFSESLTVRILGDSSHLERTLEGVARRIGELQSQLAQAAEAPAGLGRIVASFGMLERPLEAVSRMLQRVTGQVQTLSRIPITLNVAPALASLAVLSQAIDFVALKLRLLSMIPVGIGFPMPLPVPMPIRRFAAGGLVSGPGGTDGVPALLTAGEFVLRRPVVERLGVAFLNALNQTMRPASAAPRAAAVAASPAAGPQVTNFGGVTVQVTQAADVNDVLRDLRAGEGRLRVRRG